MELQTAIARVIEGRNLDRGEMEAVMHQIMAGEADPQQVAGLLVGLRMKGETVPEITGAVAVMRELAPRVEGDFSYLVDTCGTGGDGTNTFNISTTSAFAAAAAGATVAKHGNRSVSSPSGSADVLEACGANLDLSPEVIQRAVTEVGIGFLFAPHYHGAMRHAAGPRQALRVRTLFNLLGPLANPMGATNQLLGVFGSAWLEPLAEVLRELGSRHVWVVHSDDGMDELSTCTATQVAELHHGEIRRFEIRPEQFGLRRSTLDDLRGGRMARDNAELLRAILRGQGGAKGDIVALNAGAALYLSGAAGSVSEGVKRTQTALTSGAAVAKLDEFIEFTHSPRGNPSL